VQAPKFSAILKRNLQFVKSRKLLEKRDMQKRHQLGIEDLLKYTVTLDRMHPASVDHGEKICAMQFF
jgi:hypothetical protein